MKRTVFKGRTNVRQAGLRLPPPMKTDDVVAIVKPEGDATAKPEPSAAADENDEGKQSAKVTSQYISVHACHAWNCLFCAASWPAALAQQRPMNAVHPQDFSCTRCCTCCMLCQYITECCTILMRCQVHRLQNAACCAITILNVVNGATRGCSNK